MGLVIAITVVVAMLVCAIGLHPRIPTFKKPPERHTWSVRGTVRGLMNAYLEPSLAPLLLGSVLIAVAFGITGALQVYTFC